MDFHSSIRNPGKTSCFETLMNRQIRLSSIDQLQKRLKDFTGKKINIVLRSRKVLFGELKKTDDVQLTFANMRNEQFTLPLKEISEVYLDSKQ